jgi:hypothetical protein
MKFALDGGSAACLPCPPRYNANMGSHSQFRCSMTRLLLLFVVLFATAFNVTSGEEPMPPSESPAAPVQKFGPAPTENEVKQFAANLEKAFRNKDRAKVENLLRTRDLVRRFAGDLGLSREL